MLNIINTFKIQFTGKSSRVLQNDQMLRLGALLPKLAINSISREQLQILALISYSLSFFSLGAKIYLVRNFHYSS